MRPQPNPSSGKLSSFCNTLLNQKGAIAFFSGLGLGLLTMRWLQSREKPRPTSSADQATAGRDVTSSTVNAEGDAYQHSQVVQGNAFFQLLPLEKKLLRVKTYLIELGFLHEKLLTIANKAKLNHQKNGPNMSREENIHAHRLRIQYCKMCEQLNIPVHEEFQEGEIYIKNWITPLEHNLEANIQAIYMGQELDIFELGRACYLYETAENNGEKQAEKQKIGDLLASLGCKQKHIDTTLTNIDSTTDHRKIRETLLETTQETLDAAPKHQPCRMM